MKFMLAYRIAQDGTPRFAHAVSHLGLFCLPMSHKKDARLIGVKVKKYKKTSRATSTLDTSVVLESVFI